MKAFFGKRAAVVQSDNRSFMERILDVLFDKKVIVNCEREPYLHRWYVIRSERLGLFIHKFVRSDEDRALHDHPWPFIVIPIWRGYWEHSQIPCIHCCGSDTKKEECVLIVCRRVLPVIGTRLRPATYRHRVELLNAWEKWEGVTAIPNWQRSGQPLPSWSIFIRLRKVREWGFWLPTGFQHWAAWWKEKCE